MLAIVSDLQVEYIARYTFIQPIVPLYRTCDLGEKLIPSVASCKEQPTGLFQIAVKSHLGRQSWTILRGYTAVEEGLLHFGGAFKGADGVAGWFLLFLFICFNLLVGLVKDLLSCACL